MATQTDDMHSFWLVVLGLYHLLAAVLIAGILRRHRREPPAMVAWILAILFLPIFGMLVYWLFGSRRLHRKISRRRRRVAHLLGQLKRWAHGNAQTGASAAFESSEDLAGVEQLGQRLAGTPATGGNEVCILEEANATYAALEEALRSARNHIHLEYYIWQPDDTGRGFRDLLIERARAGVECRLLLDAVGCWRLGKAFLRPLTDAGVRVAFFMPLIRWPWGRRWSLHLRNHRKIAVIDGHTAFMGSQNVGDEYRGRRQQLSPWYDTHMRIRGPAALFVQQTFAEDWYFATRERLDSAAYFHAPDHPGSCIVQILPTGPDQRESILAQVMFAAVSSARSSIRVATPYFVPDQPTRAALRHACYRGVRVELVISTHSDVPAVLWAGRSFYQELVDAGVEIYEHGAGVLHSKIVTVDERWCMVGSANMDARSFRLNFEITALIYDAGVTRALNDSIARFCGDARQIHARDVWQRSWLRQVGEGAARLFAPLL